MYNIHVLKYVIFIKICILLCILYIYIHTILSNIFPQIGRKGTGQ